MYQTFIKYSELISHMKCSNRGGYKAPHKAIYLLTIIDLVEEGIICNNRFKISCTLISKFAEVWRKHVGDTPHFNINAWNPIITWSKIYCERSITMDMKMLDALVVLNAATIFLPILRSPLIYFHFYKKKSFALFFV